MKISLNIVQSLFILPFVALSVLVGCWGVLFWSEGRQNEMLVKAEYVNQLQHQINLLRGELHVYELYRDQTSLSRVVEKRNSLGALLSSPPEVVHPDQALYLRNILLQSDSLGVLLGMLFDNRNTGGYEQDNESIDEGYRAIIGRLIVSLNNLNEDALRLSGSVLVASRQAESQANIIVRAVLVVFTGLLTVFSVLVALRVGRRIRLLHTAMNHVESGTLDQAVTVPGSDEVSDLARHFDVMRIELAEANRAKESLIAQLEQQTHTLSAQTERMHHLAHHDPLTGLPNRMMFMDSLEAAASQADRHSYRIAVLFIDLDGFKQINDSLGHDAGDQVLVAVSERLSHLLRKSDLVARLGGDEFVVLLNPVTDLLQPKNVADKLASYTGQPLFIGDQVIKPAASIGISIYPDQASSISSLLKTADQAMYDIKSAHKQS